MTAFDLLQVLQFLGRPGRLTLRQAQGAEARCIVSRDGIISAQCGLLQGREAALSFCWWKEGEFRFELETDGPVEAATGAGPIQIQEILLEAVRLADEIEVRSHSTPSRSTSLELVKAGAPDGSLRDAIAAGAVVEFLARNPGTDRHGLEASLPFAPVTVGYAVVRLREAGILRSRDERAAEATAPDEVTSGSPLRALLAFDADSWEEVDRLLTAIHERLGTTSAARMLEPNAPSFHRTRLPSGRTLSITILPVARRNRFLFESMLGSVDFAALLLSDRTSGEGAEWIKLRNDFPVVVTDAATTAVAEAIDTLVQVKGRAQA
jgi:hypothetical protein